MIKEFRAFPECDRWEANSPPKVTWQGKMTVNLKFIATARPGAWPGGTTITTMGSSTQFEIEADYQEFSAKWLAAFD